VPRGKVIEGVWNNCKTFSGTTRAYWVYIPAQYDSKEPANLMVFQDGGGFVRENGHTRVPIVFDNLIHRKEIPVTIGLFINPGIILGAEPGRQPRRNRAYEYDTVSTDYANFIAEELWPAVAKKHKLKISGIPRARAICGNSSGGIAAFTAAWHRPDFFGGVISHIGSFTNIRGGICVSGFDPKNREEKNPCLVTGRTARPGQSSWALAAFKCRSFQSVGIQGVRA
jgi:enterochelin esterase family protein